MWHSRRSIRKVYDAAEAAYENGVQWKHGRSPAPSAASPLRIAFDAGIEASKAWDAAWAARTEKDPYPAIHQRDKLPLEVWVRVYADWLRRAAHA